jgi:hypothetical protein
MMCRLSVTSRLFLENAKFKQGLSLIFVTAGMVFLGFSSYSGGEAAGYDSESVLYTDDTVTSAFGAVSSGYGFACFCYLIASLLMFAAAIYVSPACCG